MTPTEPIGRCWLAAICVGLATLASPCLQAGAADDDHGAAAVEFAGGAPVVRLSAAQQRDAGIEVATPVTETVAADNRAVGVVVDLQPLIKLRGDYRGALGERDSIAPVLDAARQNVQQL